MRRHLNLYLPLQELRMATKAGTAAAYKKLTQREHILLRSAMYIGSMDRVKESRWIYNVETKDMEWKEISLAPAFLKLFDEVLVNALDHKVRQEGLLKTVPDATPVKHIDVTLTPTFISVKNDGDGIPVVKHESGVWIPQMIFGELLTSSNYDESEEKVIGGMNGLGSKLTSVFSLEFTLTTVDHRNKKKYTQTWKHNMSTCDTPHIVASSVKPFTEVKYVPDLARFGITGTEIPKEVLDVLATRVVDAAMSAGKDCKVSLNGVVLANNTFPKYMDLYLKDTAIVAYEQAGDRWEIGAVLTRDLHGDSLPDQRHISFVNGIYTRKGGKHVEYVSQKVLTAFCEEAKKKAKLEITPALLRDSVVWFVNATIVNPAFDTQTKETLTTPASKFGSIPEISPKFITTLGKIGLLEEARILLEAKTKKDAKRTDGKKRATVRGIPKLEDAVWAGTAKSAECTLILTEGDSAATTAISGLKVIGRETFGVFPLKGKILNVKDVAAAKRIANEELTNINKILGLEHGKVYKTLSELRYGRIMIMTDQDVDGSHIKGLLMNLFHTDWPSLLKLGYLRCMMTPLLKATKGASTLCFYSESEYEAWKASNDVKGWKTKYYKGLGTSTAEEARDYFRTMNIVQYAWEETLTDGAIDLAFNKKRADDRKDWLATYRRDRHLEIGPTGGTVGYSKFVNDELIHFSVADNLRSLPHVMDGLKPSQRKILWSALKRNLVSEIRVAQLAGYVSETAAYHHGEVSLHGAIIGMAQTFVGSNNLNLLAPNGQFGSRLMGGSDAASPRYIHTALEPILKYLIRKEDDPILTMMDDDGLSVEPETYLPVVPLFLINGALGIGTGYSTTVPPYNPLDLVKALRNKIAGTAVGSLTPWWFGFKGPVTALNETTYMTKGLYEFVDEEACTIRIRELPVGLWTKDYKEFLEEMLVKQEEGKKGTSPPMTHLKSFEEAYNDIDVDFILHMEHDAYHEAKRYPEEFEKRFKMTTTYKTSNMVAFDVDGKIRKFATAKEILDQFYTTRLSAYTRRKAYQLGEYEKQLIELNAKYVFVLAIVEKRLVVTNVSDEDLLAGLTGLKLPPLSDGDGLKGYEYLLRMRIDRLKASSVAELAKDVVDMTAERDALVATSVETIWLKELEAFETAWTTYSKDRTATYTVVSGEPAKKKRAKK